MRVVGAAVGAVVGFYLGGPLGAFQGASIGYGLGSVIDPQTQRVRGPRLDDLKAPQASYGAPIAYVEGSPRLAGCFIWSSDKREISHTETQGKGGPGVESTTFTYEIDCLIELAINECVGIRRCWSNGKLVWSAADDADDETLEASGGTELWRDIRFYGGAADQLPDPTYEAAVGVGNAPAYRGRSTIVIEGLNLGGSGQLPVLTFELVAAGAADHTDLATTLLDLPFDGPGIDPVYPVTGVTGVAPYCGPGYNFMLPAFTGGIGGRYYYMVQAGLPPDAAITGPLTTGGEENYSFPVSGMTDEPGYWLVSGDDGAGVAWLLDSDNVAYPSMEASAAKAYARFLGTTLLMTAGVSPFVAYPRGIGYGSITTTTSFTPSCAALYSGAWYVLPETSDGSIYIYDSDLVADGTIADPRGLGQTSGVVATDTVTGELYFHDPNVSTLYKWIAGDWAVWIDTLPAEFGGGGNFGITITDGVLYAVDFTGSPPTGSMQIYKLSRHPTVSIEDTPLSDVVERLCVRTGLLATSDIDVTDLEDDVVRAMALSQVGATRAALEILAGAYLFECVENDKLRFVKRGGSSVATIPYVDLGASDDGSVEPLPKKVLNDIEVPAQVTVKFSNVDNDMQDGAESGDRLVSESTAVSVVELPIGFKPGEAKKLADANTMDLAVSLLQIGPIALSRAYAALEPTDVITLTDADSSTFRARIVRATLAGGVSTLELVLDDATVVNSEAETDEDYASSTLVRVISDSIAVPLDIPLLRDGDDGPGFYMGVEASSTWPGAEIDASLDNVSYAQVATITDRTVLGSASTLLGDFTGGTLFDEVNALTVDVGDGTLSSATRAQLLQQDANALLVGSEIIQYRTATFVSPGVYTLSGLLRGRRGTEWAIPGHAANERVVRLQPTGLRHITEQTADVGIEHFWKAITFGKSKGSAQAVAFTDTGISLKPFAPVDLRLSDSVISWNRRSRLSGRLFGTVPLGESAEAYDVELRDGSDVLVASATVAEPQYTVSTLVEDSAAFVGVGFTPVWGKRTISGEDLAVADDGISVSTGHRYLVRLDATDHSTIQSTPGGALGIANMVWQFFNDGDALYVVTDDYYPTTPYAYKNSKVQKFTRTTLDTLDAVNTSSTPGDYKGGAFDGTDVWVGEQSSGNLRRLDASTLVSIAAYAFTGGPGAMVYDSGKLYVNCFQSDELVKFDTAAHTEDWRVSTVGSPSDVLVVGSLAFVIGDSISVHDTATGAVVLSHALVAGIYLPQRAMNLVGSQVVIMTTTGILFLDAATGTQDDFIVNPTAEVVFVAGEFGSDLGLVVSSTYGGSRNTRLYTVAPPNLAGYSVTVYQRSATVGRGYPATLEL